jgi:hypothetical protein
MFFPRFFTHFLFFSLALYLQYPLLYIICAYVCYSCTLLPSDRFVYCLVQALISITYLYPDPWTIVDIQQLKFDSSQKNIELL